ncbi:bifunctional diaminohydroxyphosphoribosylaminopyrimidine deaminase/5-amino-6-(5-phosphoribosylamino)uracil reductase RibD [Rheinheimera sp. MMS21-TC3]|uniref:bifunctional diaminohydroxyphosphoribosylaminopyrimidine deaminase/5-amino-6-(5-phosphoribosylamino)uracil reductase RibD n=1 Tax=Rheinheimera sp. MMS21-TC3 TaxID=3072790 RepID=UPI0028C3DC3E|nr:bifunctional diaminohydroxyphosphoribosylaminopyrimidine deaminase/5-amino-6-(5-phosphoribosylamino)uracil reductase RibD [Rheinheimera sp. MMS21-TC3]WNO61420.1 bifunctional diaminohydroxyphosphoribosylaminopyrimidine deaminase/5-amino-6-(5-phosphoribosylamino)uracil reductase RibD [Rheinheimera sp. MMS21-TC3]
MLSEQDKHWMQRAIELARQGRFTTSPNPNVGAVIVKNNNCIGEGYHQQAGGPHAEVFALQQAAAAAKGATCYVTLEPCSHVGRTAPCAQALIDAGVSRVVVAMQDPNPQVAGKGIALLEEAGIKVEVGLLAEQSRALNAGFLSRMEQKRPFVQLKLAASLDGRTALANGVSKWLTGAEARADVQLYRAQSCAILSTATTVLTDNARLNLRAEELSSSVPRLNNGLLRQPKKIILDRQHLLTGQEALFNDQTEVLQCVTRLENSKLKPHNATQLLCKTAKDGRFDLVALLQQLATEQQLNTLWVEAGATLAGSLISQRLVDELIVYIAPKLLGNFAQPLAVLDNFTSLEQVPTLTWHSLTKVGADIKLTARFN